MILITFIAIIVFLFSLFVPISSPLVIIAYIIVAITYSSKKKKVRNQLGIPKDAVKIIHGKNDSFPQLGANLYFASSGNTIMLWDIKAMQEVKIDKSNITSYYMIGEQTTNTTITGGGPSVGGAVVGGALFGVTGALIGGRKKVKTTTRTADSRKAIIKFTDGIEEKGIIIIKPDAIWEALCYMCPDKKKDI